MPPVEDDAGSDQASEATAFSPSNSFITSMDCTNDSTAHENNVDEKSTESNLPNERLVAGNNVGENTTLSSNTNQELSVNGEHPESNASTLENESEAGMRLLGLTEASPVDDISSTNVSIDQIPSQISTSSNVSSNVSTNIEYSSSLNSNVSSSSNNSYALSTEPLGHQPSPFDHSSESDNSHTTSSSSSSSDSEESESDMFGPPRNHSVTSPPPRCKTRVPMISARLRLKEERRKVIRLCGEKLERIRDPDSDLRRSVCINNTYYRLQAEVRKEKQGKHEQQLRQLQQLDQPRSITPLPSIDSMLNTSHHENDLEKIDRELSAISDSFDSNLEREKISIRPSEDVLRSYGYNNSLDIKYNNTIDGIDYNITSSTSQNMINGDMNIAYNKLNQTQAIDMGYASASYNGDKVSSSSYDLNYDNIKNVEFNLEKDDEQKVTSTNYHNIAFDNIKEARFETSNEINGYGSAKPVMYNNIDNHNAIYDEKMLNYDYALQANKNLSNIYQNGSNYEMGKQQFKDSRNYLAEGSQPNINNSTKDIDYKDIYSTENQQKNNVEEIEIDVCGNSYEFDQKSDQRNDVHIPYRGTDLEQKSAKDILSDTPSETKSSFGDKDKIPNDNLRKRAHEEVDDKLVQEVLSHLYAQQPATKPVTAIEDIEPEIKKFKLEESTTNTCDNKDIDLQDSLKRRHSLDSDTTEKRTKIEQNLHNEVSNFGYVNKANLNNADDKTESEKVEDNKVGANTNSQDCQQNENGTNLKSDFEIILDALRLGSPGSSCGSSQGSPSDESTTQDTQDQSNKRNKCLDTCGQAAILADIGGSNFHGLITSLET